MNQSTDIDTSKTSQSSFFDRAVNALSTTEQKVFWGVFLIFLASTVIIGIKIDDRFMVEVPAHGGEFVEGVIGFPRHINPVLAKTDTDRDLSMLIYSGLLRKSPDGMFVPDLAAGMSVSEDGKVYTLTLKDGLVWHDGAAVTSADVAYTVSAIQDGSRETKSVRRASWEGITVTTPDQKTVVFTLPAAYAPFPEQLTVGILPAHLWNSLPRDQFDLTNLNLRPVGTGPFQVESVAERSDGIPIEYILKPFTKFALGNAYVGSVRIRFYGNRDELLKAYQAKDIIAMGEIDPSLADTLTKDPNTRLLSAPLERVFALYFNQAQSQVFQDKAVRQALELATDRDAIVATVLHGYGTPIDGPTPPGRFGEVAIATTTYAERLADASSTLGSAGWKKNTDGIYEKTDKKKKSTQTLSFSIATGDTDELKSAAQTLAAQWTALGAHVEVKVYDTSTLTKEVISPRHYDALLYGAVVDRLPDLLPFWHSSQRMDPGLNIAMYANSKADKFLEDARKAQKPEDEQRALEGFEAELKNDNPAVFLYAPAYLYAVSPTAGGLSFGTLSTQSERFQSITDWYLKTERVWPIFAHGRPNIIHD